jgi:hypothetical protein
LSRIIFGDLFLFRQHAAQPKLYELLWAVIQRLHRRIKTHWPDTRITLRGDGH